MNKSGHAAEATGAGHCARLDRGLALLRTPFSGRPQPIRTGFVARTFHAGLLLSLLAGVALMLLGAGSAAAQDRTHQITWGHPSPSQVSRFVVLVSPVEGEVPETREINVGLPTAQTIGNMSLYSAVISFSAAEYLAIAAVGHDGQISIPSNWSGMPPSRPGQPLLVEP